MPRELTVHDTADAYTPSQIASMIQRIGVKKVQLPYL